MLDIKLIRERPDFVRERLATRVSCQSPDAAITQAYRYAFARDPSTSELATMRDHAEKSGLAHVCWTLFNSTEFMYVR